ncbi:MAG: insulinase family protein [Caldilineaceae bacterium]|nr:insulinase family protein [Caldilineaceae bacterium]
MTVALDYGFELLRDETIEELQTRARIYRHQQSGAELLSLENDDENKVFGVTFRTPPTDSTGLPHIMEHAVLSGSQKYPLKEPFVQLVKGSLKTYLNASTYPDKTLYPVASTNTQDFYNLIDVYLDAVFHPLLTRNHLAQEGWHYELASPDGPLIYKGVVFNEMKGAYSSPDSLLFRFGKQALFPDNAYRHDSGGDPREIPNLTYEQFRAFHATYYHPSNALIYFYGDDDPEQRLKLLDEQLRAFHAINVDSAVPLQRPFAQPTQSAFTYAADAETDLHNKNYIQLSWLLPENEDRSLVMGLSALSYAILGTPASPLRKALTESGLGEDVTGGGLGTYLRQMVFSVGMKGVAVDKLTAVETLILETLTTLATDGIEAATIEAAVNTIEFNLRENNTGSYPRGLSLMLRALSTWAYGRDPLMPLRYEEPLAELKETLAENPAYFQQLIQTYLLDNAHRNTVTLHPDGDLAQQMRAAEEEQLAQVYATLDEPKRQAIVEQAAELQRIHEAPDNPAALAALPMLTLGDLEKEVKTIPLLVEHAHGAEILFHDLFTNGILYLNVGFDLKTVPHHLLPYLHLFGRALLEMGTATEDYVQLQQRIGAKTGGIWHSTLVAPQTNSSETIAKFFLSGKATVAQSPEMFAIMQDMLCGVALDNRDRFRQIVLKAKARNEAALVPSGHSVVADRIRAAFNTAYWIEEETGGVNYLFFLRKLIQRIDEDWPSVLQELEQLRALLIRRDGLLINATLDGTNWQQLQPALQQFITALPSATPAGVQWAPTFVMSDEGLIIPAQVNYVGKATNLYDVGYTYHGSVNVISNFVRTSWLWDKIRMQGGAYGAFCRFGKQSGVLTFLSYRDPNLLQTLAVYDQTVAVLRAVDLNAQELTRNIIGAISAMDSYQLPDAKGYTSMVRHLMQESDEMRQQTRDEVLGTTLADFHNFADVVATALPAARVVVMGSQQALSAANAERPDWLQLQKVM